MTALIVVEGVAIVLLGLLVAGLLRSHAEILRHLHDMGIGLDHSGGGRQASGAGLISLDSLAAAPAGASSPSPSGLPTPHRPEFPEARDLVGTTPSGDAVAVGVTGSRQDTLLAFLSSGCLTCGAFWQALSDPARRRLADDRRVIVVTKGPDEESLSKIHELAADDLPVIMSSEAWHDYHVPGSPYFVYVEGESGRVRGEGTGASWQQVLGLLAQATGDQTLAEEGGRRRRGRRDKWPSDAEREARVDQELLAAGITPGHPSLYPTESGSGSGVDPQASSTTPS